MIAERIDWSKVSTEEVLREIRRDIEENAKTPLIDRQICHKNPNARFVITDELNLKEDEAIVCVGMAGGANIGPENPSWKTIRFSTKELDIATFEDRVTGVLDMIMNESAKYHGWTKDKPISFFEFLYV